jgi:ABC-type bacteriocin/lantibiotic exporter with double-glycine peptidase domain
LGIARALFTKPKLIVFDEATSALDNQTEALITSSIESLEGKVTVVVVAHRLSTVRKAKKVYYVEEGKIVASGTFDEVRSIIPNFNIQASLLEI